MKNYLHWFITLGLYGAVLVPAILLSPDVGLFNNKWLRLELIVGGIVVAHFLASFQIIRETEIAARVFLGKPINNCLSGFTYVPALICWTQRFERNVFVEALNTQKFNTGSPGIKLPTYFKDPINKAANRERLDEIMIKPSDWDNLSEDEKSQEYRKADREFEFNRIINGFGEEIAAAEKMIRSNPYNRQMTIEVSVTFRWTISDPAVFLTRLNSINAAKENLSEVALGSVTRGLGKMTPAVSLNHLQHINVYLLDELNGQTADWGIKVEMLQIKLIIFDDEIVNATAALAAQEARSAQVVLMAVADGEAKRQLAIGEAEAIRLKGVAEGNREESIGKGKAAAVKAEIAARTEGMKQMAAKKEEDGLGVSAEAVLAAETARAITSGGNKVIIAGGGGMADIIRMAVAVKESLPEEIPEEKKKDNDEGGPKGGKP